MTEETKDMEKDLQEIREVNQVILERLNGVLDQRDYVCNCECHRKGDQAEIKILSERLAELEERDKQRKDDIAAIKRDLENLGGVLRKLMSPSANDSDKSLVKQSEKQTEKQTDKRAGGCKNDTGNDVIVGFTFEDPNGVQQKTVLDDAEQSVSINRLTERVVNTDTLESEKPNLSNIAKPMTRDISEQSAVSKVSVDMSADSTKIDSGGGINERETKDSTVKPITDPRKVMKPNFQRKKEDTTKRTREFRKPQVKIELIKKNLPKQVWWDLGKAEEINGSMTEVRLLDGVHTILCVDISESMADAWSEVQTFVFDYLEGLEKLISEENFKEENVALVVFGHEVKTMVKLTKDLGKIRTAFESIVLGGPSNMYAGLLMAAFTAQSNSMTCFVNGAEIHKRVVLISDGHLSEAELSSGPDVPDKTKLDETMAHLLELMDRYPQSGKELICVPVGKANMDIYDQVQAIACGKRFSYTEGKKFSRRYYLTKKSPIGLGLGGLLGGLPGLEGLGGLAGLGLQNLGGFAGLSSNTGTSMAGMSEEDHEHIKEIQEDHKRFTLESFARKAASQEDNKYHESNHKELLPIGSRVKRGPDWSWNEQDSHGPGTVIGHDEDGRQLWVEWDADSHRNIYHYGKGGQYDVLPADEPRVIGKNDDIKVGCLVQPGENWKFDYQRVKQYEEGTVIKVHVPNRVQVKWARGFRGDYSYSPHGPSELRLVTRYLRDQTQNMASTTAKKTRNKNKNVFP